jgi:hypothetical protein
MTGVIRWCTDDDDDGFGKVKRGFDIMEVTNVLADNTE